MNDEIHSHVLFSVHFIIQKLKNEHTFLKKYKTEKAEKSLILTEWKERKTRYFPPKTFLNVSPIHSKLLQEIQTSPDDWAKKLFELFRNSPNIIERWIVLGDDFILEALLNRLIQSLSLLSKVCTLSFLLYVHLMSLVAHPLIC